MQSKTSTQVLANPAINLELASDQLDCFWLLLLLTNLVLTDYNHLISFAFHCLVIFLDDLLPVLIKLISYSYELHILGSLKIAKNSRCDFN
jgi:hypothetical protein